MGLKENVDALKQELSTEEQFLESFIKSEKFWKRYKKLIISLLVLLFAIFSIYKIFDYMKHRDLIASNKAYLNLLQNPNDSKSVNILKSKNPNLYELYLFQTGIKSSNSSDLTKLSNSVKGSILKDLVEYQKDSQSQKNLQAYTKKQDALLKEFALLEEGYLLLKENKRKEAEKILNEISVNSPVGMMAKSLKHYMK